MILSHCYTGKRVIAYCNPPKWQKQSTANLTESRICSCLWSTLRNHIIISTNHVHLRLVITVRLIKLQAKPPFWRSHLRNWNYKQNKSWNQPRNPNFIPCQRVLHSWGSNPRSIVIQDTLWDITKGKTTTSFPPWRSAPRNPCRGVSGKL